MQIYDVLKQDHAKVKHLFDEIEATSDRALKTREKLFMQLKTEIEAHSLSEEAVFYDAIRGQEATHDMVLEAIEEHHVVDLLLKEIAALPVEDEAWMAKLTVLKENVTHHIEEEEKEIFKKAKKVLDKEQSDELGDQMKTEEERVKSELH